MSIAIKEVTISLSASDAIEGQIELSTLNTIGWQIALINPADDQTGAQLVCNVHLILMN